MVACIFTNHYSHDTAFNKFKATKGVNAEDDAKEDHIFDEARTDTRAMAQMMECQQAK